MYVKDLSSFIAKSVKEIEYVMSIGNQNRSVGWVCMCVYTCTYNNLCIILQCTKYMYIQCECTCTCSECECVYNNVHVHVMWMYIQ